MELGLRFRAQDAIGEVAPGEPGLVVRYRANGAAVPSQFRTLQADDSGRVLLAKASFTTSLETHTDTSLEIVPSNDGGGDPAIGSLVRVGGVHVVRLVNGFVDASIVGLSRDSLFTSLLVDGETVLSPGDVSDPTDNDRNSVRLIGRGGVQELEAFPWLVENGPVKATVRVPARIDALDGGEDYRVDFLVTLVRGRRDLDITLVLHAGTPGRFEHLTLPEFGDVVFELRPSWIAGSSPYRVILPEPTLNGLAGGGTRSFSLPSGAGEVIERVHAFTEPSAYESDPYLRDAFSADYRPWVASHVDGNERVYDIVGVGTFVRGGGGFTNENTFCSSDWISVEASGSNRQVTLQLEDGRQVFPYGFDFDAETATLRLRLAPRRARFAGQEVGLTYGRRRSWHVRLGFSRGVPDAELEKRADRAVRPISARPELAFMNRARGSRRWVNPRAYAALSRTCRCHGPWLGRRSRSWIRFRRPFLHAQ